MIVSLMHWRVFPPGMQGFWASREVISYQFYLLAGMVVALHMDDVHQWIVRHVRLVLAVTVAAAVVAEVWYVLSARHDVPWLGSGSDPLQPIVIPFNIGAIACIYLVGVYLVDRRRSTTVRAMVRSGSDNSYGVYLGQMVFILALSWLGWRQLDQYLSWPVVSVLTVTVVFLACVLMTSLLSRTPVTVPLTGRQRQEWRTWVPERWRSRPTTADELAAEEAVSSPIDPEPCRAKPASVTDDLSGRRSAGGQLRRRHRSVTGGRGFYLRQFDLYRSVAFVAVVAQHSVLWPVAGNAQFGWGSVMILHATRELFFFLSAFVALYAQATRRRGIGSLWYRRLSQIAVPYLAWTVIYWTYTLIAHSQAMGAWGSFAHDLWWGYYQLYYAVVLIQFYVLLPLLVWLVRVTRRYHWWVLGVSAVLQLAMMVVTHYFSWHTGVAGTIRHYDFNLTTSRVIVGYQLYLILGLLAADHAGRHPAVRRPPAPGDRRRGGRGRRADDRLLRRRTRAPPDAGPRVRPLPAGRGRLVRRGHRRALRARLDLGRPGGRAYRAVADRPVGHVGLRRVRWLLLLAHPRPPARPDRPHRGRAGDRDVVVVGDDDRPVPGDAARDGRPRHGRPVDAAAVRPDRPRPAGRAGRAGVVPAVSPAPVRRRSARRRSGRTRSARRPVSQAGRAWAATAPATT